MTADTVRLSIDIPRSLHKALKFYTVNHDTTIKDFFLDLFEKNMPEEIGDIGFPLILHPRDVDTLWVFPMDGSDVWPRTCVNGEPALYKSINGGSDWVRQDNGFPDNNAWFTVMRQATAHDFQDPLGLYVGTKGGEVWSSIDEGETWQNIIRHLPEVYSLEIVVNKQ